MHEHILIVDDEIEYCKSLSELLEEKGFCCVFTPKPQNTLSIVKNQKISFILMDVRMPEIGGIDLLKQVKQYDPDIPVIMITGYPNFKAAVTAMRYGAVNVFSKPIAIEELTKEFKAFQRDEKSTNNSRSFHPEDFPESKNPTMQEIFETIRRVSKTDAPVMILGESGTGKELIANLLHSYGMRSTKPFVKVNCAAIPEYLLESELFGHEKGAFTDAKESRSGKFEIADGGSIFLDEIGDMSLNLQAKILRVLQEQEFEKIGSNQIIQTDIRFISATNKKINELITNAEFREDLYYRISVINIEIPPLRERKEDIPSLCGYFLQRFNQVYNKHITGFSPQVWDLLDSHDWPGNIRELKNSIERAVIFCDEEKIRINHLPRQYRNLSTSKTPSNYIEASEDFDREIILDALKKSDGIKQKAAELLNIHRKTLYNKMKKLGLE